MAGEITTWGTAANFTPAREDGELVRRVRAAGAVGDRQDQPARAGDHGRHRGTLPRCHAQSLEPRAQRRPARAAEARPRSRPACAPRPPPPTGPAGSGCRPATAGWWGSSPRAISIPLSPRPEHWYGLSVVGFVTRKRGRHRPSHGCGRAGSEPGDSRRGGSPAPARGHLREAPLSDTS